jgi:predicted transcriptional regulator
MADCRRETRYPEVIRFIAPAGISRALDELAGRQHTTRSEVVRRVLVREVEAAGLQLAPQPLEAT